MKKTALILCVAFLLSLLCVPAIAAEYGAETQKLIVTHINENYAGLEGTGVVYSSSNTGTISPYGSFDWWNVVVFEWNGDEDCFVVQSVNTSMGSSKSDTPIPKNGFVYYCNVGNDYPSLGDNTKPNYKNESVSASCGLAATLKAGDKAYLYNVDLLNCTVKTDVLEWYKEGYKSESFIKIGSEEEGLIAYNPEKASEKEPEYSFGINAINTAVAEGQSMILTPSFGKTVTAKGGGYDWSRIAIFDWSDEDGAYVLKYYDTAVGTGSNKEAVIPPNGFALSVNTGNNYPALGDNTKPNYTNAVANNTYNNLANVAVGTKVYLVGIDLDKGTFEYEGNLSKYYSSEDFTTNAFIKVCEEKPEGCYEPKVVDRLDSPVFTTAETIYTKGDITLEWNAVDGAESYYVCITDTTATISGSKVFSEETSEAKITVSGDSFAVGTCLTARIYAKAENKSASKISEFVFRIVSERALNSVLRDKTVIAFGDSITAAAGGWVSMLYGEFGGEVINAGVGGNVTAQALERIESDVLSKNPDLVIINFGMNDQAYQEASKANLTPIDKYEANYRSIIEQIKNTGSDIILVAVHDVNPKYHKHSGLNYCASETLEDGTNRTYIDKYNEVVKKLADEYKLGFIDINSLAQDKLDTLTIAADGIHLSAAGQKQYAEWIANYCFEYYKKEADIIVDFPPSEAPSESDETSSPSDTTESSPKWQMILAICLTFVGVSVIGVMFLKIVKKNK